MTMYAGKKRGRLIFRPKKSTLNKAIDEILFFFLGRLVILTRINDAL